MNRLSLHSGRLTSAITLIALVIALAVSLVAVPPSRSALAQGVNVNCNGLSEDDCTLLQNAQQAMVGTTSMTLTAIDMQMKMTAEGETMNMALSGSGALLMAPALAELVAMMPQAWQGTPDMTAVFDIMDSLDEVKIQSILTESAGYLRLDRLHVFVPDSESASLQGELVVNDGTLYIGGTSPNEAEAWFGQSMVMSETDLADLREGLDEMREQMTEGEFLETMEMLTEYQDLMTALTDVVNQHVTTTRGEDATLHDQAMATFTTSMDLRAMLADPNLSTAIFNVLSSPVFTDALGESDMEQINAAQVQLMLTMVSIMFKDPVISSEQWVGLDDGALHKTASTVALTIDPSVLMDSSSDESTPITITLDTLVEVDPGAEVDPADFPIPDSYLPMDESSNFLPGSPDMIDGAIEVDETVEATLTGTSQHLYSVTVSARTPAEIVLETDGYATLALYGPDGFLIEKVTPFDGGTLNVIFEADGMYLIKVVGDQGVTYSLTLNAD